MQRVTSAVVRPRSAPFADRFQQAVLLASARESVVFVVDDDISVRESLEALFLQEGWEVRTYASAQDFLSSPKTSVPSCLVLDLNLPDLSGLDLQQRIAPNRSHLPVIFITGCGDVPTTVRAMKAGAVEFLTKPFDSIAILDAVRDALERSRIALERSYQMDAVLTCYGLLSQRERQVMSLVVTGLLNKQIAHELGISEITVKAHRGQVMRKMSASSLAELINQAAKLGLGRKL